MLTNVRTLRPGQLPFVPQVVVADLSFISLRAVIPALAGVAAQKARFVLLVKPQFEAERSAVEAGGVVHDPAAWRSALLGVVAACAQAGLGVTGAAPSPVLGPAGNVEFLLHAEAGRRPADGVPSLVDEAVAEGLVLKDARRGR